jgi:4-oxalocrotonate tautomerase family enzyme
VEIFSVPIIQMSLFKGHSAGVKTRLINAVTDAYRMVIPAPHASIAVILTELERDNYMRGGASRRRVEALPEPTAHLRAYLTALRDVDLEKAATFLAEGCTYRLPGGKVLGSPVEVMDWITKRSKIEDFRVTSIEAMPSDRGPVVYLHSEVTGTRRDGSRYENLRGVARYAFDGGKIYRVDIWDDVFEPPPSDEAPAPEADPCHH